MTEEIPTIHERIEQYRQLVGEIRSRHKAPEGGTVEDAIYDSPDAPEYDRVLKKLRAYQKLARRMEGA